MPKVLTPYGAGWCWFSGAPARYLAGRIYTGWADMGARTVAADGRVMGARVVAAVIDDDPAAGFPVRQFVLTERAQDPTKVTPEMVTADDHVNPAVLLRGPEGGEKAVYFWSGHGGPRLSYRIATDPQDVAAFGPVQAVPTQDGPYGRTYSNAWQLGDGKVYVLFRGAPNFQPWITRASSLGAGNWETARHLIAAPSGVRPYLKAVAANAGAGTLHLAYTDGHPRDVATSLFHAKFQWANGTFKRTDGAVIATWGSGLPFDTDEGTRIHAGVGNARCWIWDIQVAGPDWEPRVLYAVIRDRDRHELWTAKHTGGGTWVREQLTDQAGGTIAQDGEEQYSGGGCLDPSHPDARMWISLPRDGVHDLAEWHRSADGWAHAGWVAEPTGDQRVRPVAVRDYPSVGAKLLWMQGHYGTFVDLGSRVVLGDPL